MRRLSSLLSVVAVLLLALPAVPAAGWARTTVPPFVTDEGDELPEGAAWETIAMARVERVDLPPAGPVDVALVRVALAPGAGLPIAPDDPSLAHFVVESGELTVRYPAAVEMLATPRVVAWDTIAVAAGSGSVGLPPMGELRNDGSEPTVLLVLSVVPTGAAGVAPPATGDAEEAAEPGRITFDPVRAPDGVRFQPLAVGHVEEPPAEAWSMAIARLTAEPGVVFPADESAEVELVAVEAGSLVVTTTGGPPLRVARGLANADVLATPGPEPTAEEVGPGDAATVGAGDGVFLPIGNVAGAEVVGDEPASALLGFVAPASAPGLTGRR